MNVFKDNIDALLVLHGLEWWVNSTENVTEVESRVERLHEPDFSEIILKLMCLTELALVGILSMTMTEIWFTAIENYVRHNESRS